MAEKHKSKYKAPKDLEKSQKPKPRKDLKDYTTDDKDGGMNPKSTKEKQLNILRKTDKPTQDDGKMYPSYNADERLYKDLEDADYDPKTAAKRMEKREKEEEKTIKDKINSLTVEQKERLVREYVRRKLTLRLLEQAATETPEEEAPAEETPLEDPAAAAPAEPAITDPAAAPAPAPAPAATEPAPAETPAPEGEVMDDAQKESLAVERFSTHLRNEGGNISRIKSIAKVLNSTFKEAEPEDVHNFYKMLRTLALNKLASIKTSDTQK
jgi:hypothetical protein